MRKLNPNHNYTQPTAKIGNSEKGNEITSQESDLTWNLLNCTTMRESIIQNVLMTKQETGVGDRERPFSSTGTTQSLKHIGQRLLTEEEKKYLR